MRVANMHGRAVLLSNDLRRAVDVEQVSGGRFPADPQLVYAHWSDFHTWGKNVDVDDHPQAVGVRLADLGAPVPRPTQVFGIGLNYADHAAEANLQVPEHPMVFTKFPSSLVGPDATVQLSGDQVDWEAELVAVIGTGGRNLRQESAWDAVAGLTIGQDLSDREVQMRGQPAQFNLGKSFAGYAPTGPAVVTLDELARTADPDALGITCRISDNGEPDRTLQDGNSRDLIFTVPQLVSRLSMIVELRPGDLIFTGTPAGVGIGRNPQEFLRAGQRLVTEISGLGRIEQRFRK